RLDIYKKYIRAVLPMLQVIKDLKISIKEDMGPYCIGDVIEAFDEVDKKIRGKIISSLRQELLLQLECIYRHMEHVCRTLLEQQAPLDAQESLNAQFPSFFEIFHSYNESGGGSPHDAPNRAIEAIKQMWTLIFGLELRIDAAGLSSCLIVFHEEESGFSGPTRELRAFLAEKGFVYADMLRELSSHLVVLDKLSRGNIKKAWKLRAQAIEDFKDNIKCYQRLFVLQKEAPTELLLEKINRDLELHQKMVDWLKDQKEEHIPDIWPRLIFYKKECIVRLGALQEMFLSQIHLIFCRYVELFKEQPLDVDLLAYMRNSMDKIDQGPLSVINKPLHDQIRVVFQMLHKMITSYQMLEGAPGSIAISREFLQEETAMGDSLERSLGVLPEIFHTPFTYIRGRHKEITDRIGQRFSKE
ncbi:MAG: hypothetical protein WCN87_02340, partial [Chlamydiota bacterium]